MNKFYFTNINTFLRHIQDKSIPQKDKLYDLRINKQHATTELHSKFGSMTEEEQRYYSRELLEVCDGILLKLGKVQKEEIEYLDIFRKEVIRYVRTPSKIFSEYPEIFKSDDGLVFFLDTLRNMNIIDDDNKPKRGFQACCNAVFRDKNYKTHIFINNMRLREYIAFLNIFFNAKIKSEDKLSDPYQYEKDVANHFKEYFNVL